MPLASVEIVNWRGVVTLAVTSVANMVLYSAGIVSVPFLTTAPMTVALYLVLSLVFKTRVRENEESALEKFA